MSAETNQQEKIVATDNILHNYINLSSLPMNKRRNAFNELSANDKANAFRLHLALQLTNRLNLSTAQTDVILDSISTATADAYDRTKDRKNAELSTQNIQARAASLFSRQEASEIFAILGSNKEDVEYLQKYVNLAALKVMSDRKELFNNASPQDKSQYWRVHFAYSLALFPDLNRQQKEIILDAIALATPEIFEVSKSSSDWKAKVDDPQKLFSARALGAFGKEDGTKIFLKLGGEAESQSRPNECDCSQGSIPACWNENCPGGLCRQVDGCGVLWLYRCDGRC